VNSESLVDVLLLNLIKKQILKTDVMKLIKLNGRQGFKKLKFLPFNRTYGVRKDLVEKMNLYGFQSAIKVIMTDLFSPGVMEMYVADGQNRAATAAYLDIPFYAEVLDIKFNTKAELVMFVASLNEAQVNWETQEYVDVFIYLEYVEYITLNRLTKNSPFTVSAVASMLNDLRTKGNTPKSVKRGTFEAKLKEDFEYTMEVSAKASKFATLTNRMGLGIHFVSSRKSFDEDKFLKAFEYNYEKVRDMKLDDFTDIFLSWM
jgi:hypothetical protein